LPEVLPDTLKIKKKFQDLLRHFTGKNFTAFSCPAGQYGSIRRPRLRYT